MAAGERQAGKRRHGDMNGGRFNKYVRWGSFGIKEPGARGKRPKTGVRRDGRSAQQKEFKE